MNINHKTVVTPWDNKVCTFAEVTQMKRIVGDIYFT